MWRNVLLTALLLCCVAAFAEGPAPKFRPEPADDLERLIQSLGEGKTFKPLEPAATCDPADQGWQKAWETEGWRVSSRKTPSWKVFADPRTDCAKFTHEFKSSVVVSARSGWTPEKVDEHLRLSAGIYAQCGIRLGSPEIVWAEAPTDLGTPDLSRMDTQIAQRVTYRTPVQNRPLIYFVGVPGTSYDPLEKAQVPMTAYAFAEITIKQHPPGLKSPIQDTAFIGIEVQTDKYKNARKRFGRYDPVAHEIAHLLGNCDHVSGPTPNLLQDYEGLVSPHLTPKQCEAFKRSPLLHPLSAETRCR